MFKSCNVCGVLSARLKELEKMFSVFSNVVCEVICYVFAFCFFNVFGICLLMCFISIPVFCCVVCLRASVKSMFLTVLFA